MVNRTIKILLMFLFALNLSDGLFSPLFAVFVQDFIVGASLSTVGIAVALLSISKSVVQVPLARWLDKHGSDKGEYYAMLAGAGLGVIYPLGLTATSSSLQLYGLSIVSGIGLAFLMAAYYGMFSHHIDRKLQSYEWSLYSVGGLTVSAALGGLAGGVLADIYGLRAILYGAAALNVLAIVVLALLPLHHSFKGSRKVV